MISLYALQVLVSFLLIKTFYLLVIMFIESEQFKLLLSILAQIGYWSASLCYIFLCIIALIAQIRPFLHHQICTNGCCIRLTLLTLPIAICCALNGSFSFNFSIDSFIQETSCWYCIILQIKNKLASATLHIQHIIYRFHSVHYYSLR